MARKKKLINKTNVPQYAIERFARCVFDDIRAFYDSEEGQREFAAWKAEQAALKVHNKTARATDTAALAVFYRRFFFLGPRGFDSGRINTPLRKYTFSYFSK